MYLPELNVFHRAYLRVSCWLLGHDPVYRGIDSFRCKRCFRKITF